ncbi:hypothetical protein BGZ75_009564 [Mortierella antarctica]|nr:hypothetical protein BGZ75_009564 [Mortierella antarctica]
MAVNCSICSDLCELTAVNSLKREVSETPSVQHPEAVVPSFGHTSRRISSQASEAMVAPSAAETMPMLDGSKSKSLPRPFLFLWRKPAQVVAGAPQAPLNPEKGVVPEGSVAPGKRAALCTELCTASHAACLGCLERYISDQVTARQWPIHCPFTGCDNSIPPSIADMLLGAKAIDWHLLGVQHAIKDKMANWCS